MSFWFFTRAFIVPRSIAACASCPQAWLVSGLSETQARGLIKLSGSSCTGSASISALRAICGPGLPVSKVAINPVLLTISHGRPIDSISL